MKVSAWIAVPICAITTTALVISTVQPVNDSAIAGSIASTDPSTSTVDQLATLEQEYDKLELLKQQLFDLQNGVFKQEHAILTIINKDFEACSGVKCYLQTALRKAPDFFQLLKTHFRHHPKNSSTGTYDCSWFGKKSKAQEEPLADYTALLTTTPSSSAFAPSETFNFNYVSSTSSSVIPDPTEGPLDFNEDFQPLPFTSDEDPFHFSEDDGAPLLSAPKDEQSEDHSPAPGYFDFRPFEENPNLPAPHPQHHQPRPHHEQGSQSFHIPHPAPRHPHFRLILATATLVISVLILAGLFKACRVYLSNPRVQADRAARIEECRTRREYRRAACQHRLRQIASRFRIRRRQDDSDNGTGDYEEKRAVLQRQTNNSQATNHILGSDINSLRTIISQLMRAEEGQAQPSNTSTLPSQVEQPIASSSRSIRSIHTTITLPLYTPPPPAYSRSQELPRNTEVVDGFRYTPSNSAVTTTSSASSFIIDDDDMTEIATEAESSVVDCRSRMSIDTDSVALSQAGEHFEGGLVNPSHFLYQV